MENAKFPYQGQLPVTKTTRSERAKELERLASTDQGKWELTDIARRYLGVPEGQTIPISTLLIYVILKNEYPED